MTPPGIERIVEVLGQRSEIVGAWVFGSRSRGDAREASDLDLAVLGDTALELEQLIALEEEVARAGGVSVDLVDVSRARPYLALDVVRGERIFERDGRRLDEFELYVLRRAADLAPFERERRRTLLATSET